MEWELLWNHQSVAAFVNDVSATASALLFGVLAIRSFAMMALFFGSFERKKKSPTLVALAFVSFAPPMLICAGIVRRVMAVFDCVGACFIVAVLTLAYKHSVLWIWEELP